MFRLVIFSACRLTDMGAEEVQHGSTQVFIIIIISVFRQVKELVSAAYTHGGTFFMP